MTNEEKDLLIAYLVDAGELDPDGDLAEQFLDWYRVREGVVSGEVHYARPSSMLAGSGSEPSRRDDELETSPASTASWTTSAGRMVNIRTHRKNPGGGP